MGRLRSVTAATGLLMLAACSDDSLHHQTYGDLAQYSPATLNQMVENGELTKVAEIILARRQAGIASQADYVLLSDIYLDLNKGLEAQIAVERARTSGATLQSTATTMAEALIQQGLFDAAEKELSITQLTGEQGFETYFLRGKIAHARNDKETAKQNFLSASEIKPDSHLVHLSLALIALDGGDFTEAHRHAEAAVEHGAEDTMSFYALGAIERVRQNHDIALANLEEAINLNPLNLLARLEMVGTYIDINQLDAADKELDEIFTLAPGYQLAHFYVALLQSRRGQLAEAEETLFSAGDILEAYAPANRLYGYILFRQEKYKKATGHLRTALENNPADREVRLALAESLRKTGLEQLAIQTLAPLEAEDEQDLNAAVQAAVTNEKLGNFEEAERDYSRAATLAAAGNENAQADHAQLRERSAIAAFASGRQAEGISMLKDAISATGATTDNLLKLANMQLQAGTLADAQETASRLSSMEGGEAEAHNVLGSILHRQKKFEAAVEAYTKALNSNPDYPSARKNRAAANMALGNYGAVVQELSPMFEATEGDPELAGMLGIAQVEIGDLTAAMAPLSRARDLAPENARYAAYRSLVLAEQGRLEEAVREAKTAQQLAKGNRQLVKGLQDKIDSFESALRNQN